MIPFLDLKAQYATIGAELEAAVLSTLRSGAYVLGEDVERFEEAFATYCGTRHAVAVNTGTSALHLALLAAGIGPGDEVITVPMTFVATVAAIVYAGATPVFVDIDPATWTMDPAAVEAAITPRSRAILPVHLHGRLAEMAPLVALANRHGLTLIEDAAQAHGARRGSQRAGAFGAMGCFSFYPGKNLGACGEGGAVTTNDAGLAETVRSLRDWGQAGKYNHVRHGFNYRMDGLQGAALGIKLRHLEGWTAARRRVAQTYQSALAGAVRRPAEIGDDHACHVYAIRVAGRDRVREDSVSDRRGDQHPLSPTGSSAARLCRARPPRGGVPNRGGPSQRDPLPSSLSGTDTGADRRRRRGRQPRGRRRTRPLRLKERSCTISEDRRS